MTQNQAVVIGSPISHSLSPGIFSFLASRLGKFDFNYQAQKIEPEELDNFLREFKRGTHIIGLNVTIPHKETILKLLNQLSPAAQTIGAVNVVQRQAEILYGHNTDVHGIIWTLKNHQCIVKEKTAFILGAGGAARSIAFVLGSQKAKQVQFLNNDLDRAESLVRKFTSIFPETRFQAGSLQGKYKFPPIDLWANTTPLGMAGVPTTQAGQPALDYFTQIYTTHGLTFSERSHAFDLIYRPEETPFLIVAKKLGLKPIGGLDMLVEQALQTWGIWFGNTPELEHIRPELMDYLRNRPLFLTGFMGAGKSTVGALLARKLGWQLLDIDLLIEREAQMSISEIFKKDGESRFREIESQIIRKFAFSSRTVIALGGGALSNTATRNIIKKSGQLVFLSAQPSTLVERLRRVPNYRPLLESVFAEENPDEQRLKISMLLKQREESYFSATLKVETDHLSPEEIIQKIIENI